MSIFIELLLSIIMNFQKLSPYIGYITTSLLLLIGLYVKTFITEKAKNKALLKSISRITEEKELIITRHQKEIQLIKKEHDLDIAKRKYRYESKSEAYNKFLVFLDNFNSKVGEELTTKFLPVVEKFMKDSLDAEEKSKNEIMSNFFKETIELSKEAYSEYKILKQETNAIKLCASPAVLIGIDHLETLTKETLDESEIMMQRMPVLITANDKDFNKQYQEYITSLGQNIEISKKNLIESMRLDLETI